MFYAKTFFDLTIYFMTEKFHGIYFYKTELKNINQRSVLGSAELEDSQQPPSHYDDKICWLKSQINTF